MNKLERLNLWAKRYEDERGANERLSDWMRSDEGRLLCGMLWAMSRAKANRLRLAVAACGSDLYRIGVECGRVQASEEVCADLADKVFSGREGDEC